MPTDPTIPILQNDAAHRFEATVDGATAVADYTRAGDTIAFTHTEVPPELRGRGVGSALARAALEYARVNTLRVIPACPFIARYIERHPEYAASVEGG